VSKLITFFWLLVCAFIVAVGAMMLWVAVLLFTYGLWLISLCLVISCVLAGLLAIMIWEVVNSRHKFPDDWSKKNDQDN
jgi:membrane protein implicated in regulation of membrane protease activity